MDGGTINIIRLVVDIYATVLLVRLLLQLVQADFFNPLSQTIFKITAPVVEPLHKIFPTIGRFNTAALVSAILVKWSFFLIIMSFDSVSASQIAMLLGVAALSLLGTLIEIYFYGILIVAISSWIGTTSHPTVRLVSQIIDPYMKPFRKIIPPLGMIDISPMVAIFTLIFIRGQLLPVLSSLF
ncbi:MAG: YggT family protein [Polaribacter sp.]|jgi:YggT family protein|tara:strand:+ start:5034 stop:5582 length:549 start_codon:yes stop_codon:yes gene_type:complete